MPDDTSAPTLRERKKRATRERLLDAAEELFVERGYDATTMDEIAARADVSRATAFNYLPRKDGFLFAWAAARREQVAQLLAREEDEAVGTADRIRHALMTLCDLVEANAESNRSLLRAYVRAGGPLLPGASATAEVFARTLGVGQQRGDIRADVDVDAAGRVLFDAYVGALVRWSSEEEEEAVPLRPALETVGRVTLDGLRPR
jgi:TetR/AcrR family transcriptional regulator, cholesterol catabolism regulator